MAIFPHAVFVRYGQFSEPLSHYMLHLTAAKRMHFGKSCQRNWALTFETRESASVTAMVTGSKMAVQRVDAGLTPSLVLLLPLLAVCSGTNLLPSEDPVFQSVKW